MNRQTNNGQLVDEYEKRREFLCLCKQLVDEQGFLLVLPLTLPIPNSACTLPHLLPMQIK